MTESTRAIVRINDNYLTVLCPNGHVITGQQLDSSFAGSRTEAMVSAHQHGEETMWDRQAARCAEYDKQENS